MGHVQIRLSRFLLVAAAAACGCATTDDRLAQLEQRVARLEAAAAKQTAPEAAQTARRRDATLPSVFTQEGWFMSGGGRDVYDVRPDAEVQRGGYPTLLLAPSAGTLGKYGTWMRSLDAAPFRGKRIRMSVYTKTEGATRRVDFWARVQAIGSPGDGPGLGGRWTQLPATSDWTRQEIVLDVDPAGHSVQYGVGIAGPGRLWVDEPKLETVGPDVPVTSPYPGEQTVGDWLMTGVGAPDYTLSQDGAAVRLDAKLDSKRFVHVLRVAPAAPHVGKTVKLSLQVRTKGKEDRALCVAKVLRSPQWVYMGGLKMGMQEPSAKVSKRFVPCDIKIEVPEGAKWILYGVGTRGAGTAWVRGGTIR